MFIGEHNHTLDDKNRLSLPAKFRKVFGKSVVVTHGLDNCLFVYTTKEWEVFVTTLGGLSMGQKNSRSFSRFLLGSAVEVDIDSAGRILLPDFLRSFANLKQKVTVVGVGNRAELWSDGAWKKYKLEIEKSADVLAEQLGNIGMI